MLDELREEIRKTVILLIIGIIIAGFVLVNVVWKAGVIYLALLIVSLLVLINWDNIVRWFGG